MRKPSSSLRLSIWYSPGWGFTGLLRGGVDVGEGPRELFIACDDTLAALLTTGGLLLYWPWPGSGDGGHCPWYCAWEP